MKSTDLLRHVREYARHPYTSLGGYPLILYTTSSDVLCCDCVKNNYRQISTSTHARAWDGWAASGVDIYYEGPPAYCANCNAEIESAYGDPEAEGAEA